MTKHICPYCDKELPEAWSACCGEKGHAQPVPEQEQKECREAFEHICSENGHNVERVADENHINFNQYKDAGVQALWDWHQANTRATPALPDHIPDATKMVAHSDKAEVVEAYRVVEDALWFYCHKQEVFTDARGRRVTRFIPKDGEGEFMAKQALAALPALQPQAGEVELVTAAKALAGVKYDDNQGFCSTLEQSGDRGRYTERYYRSEIRFAKACADAWGLKHTTTIPKAPTKPEQEGV